MNDVIDTGRLLLRPLRRDDGPAIAMKINSYEISKNLARVPYPYSLADAEEFLDWALGLDHHSAFRVISLKDQPDDLIGLISYDWVEAKLASELGYWLVPEHWGNGLMTEAACAMVDHAFAVAGLDQLYSCYFLENPASGKVLAHAGFSETGHCKSPSKARGEDVAVMTVHQTRAMWAKKKAAV